uniref:Putative muscle cell homeostasis n=1 Tax=Corethrella appendiculata TaxID=1370023 RepID=U5EW31_9DIPT
MKFSTTNTKNSSYNENHIIYVGTHTGSFKKVDVFKDNPFSQANLQDVKVLNKDTKVTCMEYGNDAHDEILIGRANQFIKTYDCRSENFQSNIEIKGGAIIGVGRFDDCLVAATSTGNIEVIKDAPEPVKFSAGNELERMRVSTFDRNLIVTGGKGLQNILKVWDLNTKTSVFAAKNVRHDMLELQQPIWENDVQFIDSNLLASCSRHGYVRVYDRRGPARRPVQAYFSKDTDDQLSFTCLASFGNFLYAGTSIFGMRGFDIRKMKQHIHTYKGFSGTVTSLHVDKTGKYIFSASLDRYVRIHNADKTYLLYQCYVKSKPTQILCQDAGSIDKITSAEAENSDCEIVNQPSNDVDSEYEDLFTKMQTVDEDETGGKKQAEKRKAETVETNKFKKKSKKKNNKNVKS